MEMNFIKKYAITRMLRYASHQSDENIIRMIDIANKYFIKSEKVRWEAEKIRRIFVEHQPGAQLAKNTFSRISKQSLDCVIQNFFINAAVIGRQRQEQLRKELNIWLPWFFVISPTARCNLTCVGCYAGNYSKQEDLSFELVDRIFNEAKDLGIYFVTVSGGEPFMWPHLLDIMEKHHDMFFQIYTNGTLITKDVANRLGKLGNAAPAISIEGFEKETDARRGEGTFKRIMEAMDNLRNAGVPFGFSATPTKLNIETLMSDEFIDLMIEKGCSIGWFFQYVPIGRKPDVSLMATPEQRFRLRRRSIEIRNTKPIFIGDFWNDGPYVGGCICGARQAGYFHINCHGDVEPCVFLQFSVDNIKDKKLIDVIQSPFFKAFQEAQPYRENNNLLTPCALIDNPQVLRDIVTKFNAKPSYNSSMDVITDPEIISFLDNYTKEYRKLVDPIWENDLKFKYKTWKQRWTNN
ncbi:MAG TPA: radical SAM protein [Bacteroidales bacterium]|jgi:MoaA/NifB/PqqE/SkfB family radical SAM enzyme|nr:radical SAM protein [Bacteroidales bacterium]HOC39863.1 radical SAM protein [Bacteroidales bacterium]HOV55326.1 radical SAM protein [Bacteroidales bacterium]HPB19178.1 radical SAM protein [Bacteroidales bacterium]HQM78219.1 radical SAM protein [Bacteroidales bacterium]